MGVRSGIEVFCARAGYEIIAKQLFVMDSVIACLHGDWEDGICKCHSGYVSEFKDDELYPMYCTKKDDEFVINLGSRYELVDFLHYGTMTVFITFNQALP